MATDDSVSVRWVLRVIARWAWLIIGCALLAGEVAFLVTSRMPPKYRAEATLLVSVPDNPATGEMTTLLVGEQLALTYSEMLNGRVVLPTVISRLGLNETPEALAKRVNASPVRDTPLIRLTATDSSPARSAEIANATADEFVTYARWLADSRTSSAVTSKIVLLERASPPTAPVIDPLLYIVIAALVGAIVGAAGAFLLAGLDDTIRSAEEVSAAAGLETIGQIGRCSKRHPLVVLSQPESQAAEEVSMLAADIRFRMTDRSLRSVLITSPAPQEGKSFVAANLGAALAAGGLRVVIVDADQCRPRQGRIFGLQDEGGLTECLRQDHVVPQLRSSGQERLKVLVSGTASRDRTALLTSPRIGKLLSTLQQDADLVIVDSPPVLAVADAAILSSKVDAVLLVLRENRSRRREARRAVEVLHQVRAPLIGVVLNGMRSSPGSHYSYYYSARKRKKRAVPRRLAGVAGRQQEKTGV